MKEIKDLIKRIEKDIPESKKRIETAILTPESYNLLNLMTNTKE